MKTVSTSIKCDGCDKELIHATGFSAEYSLVLDNVQTGYNRSGIVYGMEPHRLMREPAHFCNFLCLHSWVAKTGQVKKAVEAMRGITPEQA